jgi:hypothetical protein
MRIDKSIFTTPLPWLFNISMARKTKDKTKEEKVIERDARQRTLLEKLGFAQMVFDFYMAPVE